VTLKLRKKYRAGVVARLCTMVGLLRLSTFPGNRLCLADHCAQETDVLHSAGFARNPLRAQSVQRRV